MKSFFVFSAIFSLSFIGVSCSESDDSVPMTTTPVVTTFVATLTPEPGVTSAASGTATLTLNETTKVFQMNVNYTGLTPTKGDLLREDGVIQIPFTDTDLAVPPFVVSGTLTDAQIAGLMSGTYYVNLDTGTYPKGEISGNLSKTGTSS